MKRQRVIAILPAYHAARTLLPFLATLPTGTFDEIILVDDCSTDGTYELATKQKSIRVYQTPRNLGYGGNLKICLTLALEHGADRIVELHPDGEYAVDGIVPALEEVKKRAAFVLGNRFTDRTNTVPRGMFLSKYWVTRGLSFFDNLLLGTHIPDIHQGFRVYTKTLLDRINWRATHDDFLFSFEIICQAVFAKLPIASVPVTARYSGEKRGAAWGHSLRYALGTWTVLAGYMIAKVGFRSRLFAAPPKTAVCPICKTPALAEKYWQRGGYGVYRCHICRNGVTRPAPIHFKNFYPSSYYHTPGVLGSLKQIVFSWAQMRRSVWLKQYCTKGEVLDVGSGIGRFGLSLGPEFRVIDLDPYYPGNNASVIKQDLLTWKITKRFDAVVFWESLEHTPNPDMYIARAARLLGAGGVLFIEYPRLNSLEARLFGTHWFHLDVPRHLFHFSDRGIADVVEKHGLTIQRQHGIFALEYAPLGLLFSILSAFGLERYRNLFLPLGIFLLPLSIIELCIGQSPIGLLIAQKDATMKHSSSMG